MSKRICLIGLMCLSFLCLNAQKRYDFSFRGITIEQALSEIEERADISIVYNPREVSANKRITLTISDLSAQDAVRLVLGQDYRVQQKNGICTIKYVPVPHVPIVETETPPQMDVTEVEDAESVTEVEEPKLEIIPEIVEAESEPEVVAEVETAPEEEDLPAPRDTLSNIDRRDTLAQALPLRSPHRLSIGVTPGVGGIYTPGCVTTTFGVDYAYFFHENWGVSLGMGVDYYGKSRVDTTDQMLNFAIPVTFRMDYRLSDRLHLTGGAGMSLELPISGAYVTDDAGERYSESALIGTIADLGVAVPLGSTKHISYALGISAYGQCIVTSSGKARNELHLQGLYPWQVGLRIALHMNLKP